MFFEAEMKGHSYKINVIEGRNHWHIGLQKEDEDWVKHRIPKDDYREMDNAICFLFNNNSYMVDVVGDGLDYTVYTRASYRSIKIMNDEMLLHESLKGGGGMGGANGLKSGMPGKIVKVMVKEGDELQAGDPVLVMEAMKMENEMRAEAAVVVKKICVSDGDSVEAGADLVVFEKLKP